MFLNTGCTVPSLSNHRLLKWKDNNNNNKNYHLTARLRTPYSYGLAFLFKASLAATFPCYIIVLKLGLNLKDALHSNNFPVSLQSLGDTVWFFCSRWKKKTLIFLYDPTSQTKVDRGYSYEDLLWKAAKENKFRCCSHLMSLAPWRCTIFFFLQTLTTKLTKDCIGPQTNMPKNVAIDSCFAPKRAKQLSMASIPLCFEFFQCRVDVLQS